MLSYRFAFESSIQLLRYKILLLYLMHFDYVTFLGTVDLEMNQIEVEIFEDKTMQHT